MSTSSDPLQPTPLHFAFYILLYSINVEQLQQTPSQQWLSAKPDYCSDRVVAAQCTTKLGFLVA
jgi:hypothetical protein